MATPDLTGQQIEKDTIQLKVNKLSQLMNQRKPFWDKALVDYLKDKLKNHKFYVKG